jgi:phosphoglucosamine mutase
LGGPSGSTGAQERYIEFAKRTLPREMSLEGLRVVIDCANGAAYKVAPEALWELGADVVRMGVSPDGFNINKDCGSTSTDALVRKVHEVRADIGIALDGDADRVIIVDENGQVVDGDQLMAVVAQSWQARPLVGAGHRRDGDVQSWAGTLPGGSGLGLARTKVGDRYVVEHMRANGYNVGGEQSGHIVLSDFATTGDGLIAALQILACVKEQDKPVSEVCRRFEPVPQILKNVRYKGGAPLDIPEVKSAIEDGEARLGTSGRLVIRASGPNL